MLTIARLFGKSPFAPLQTHMDKVASCLEELPRLFLAFFSQDLETVETISAKISRLEHEADLTKNDIRNHLPKSLFLPFDREVLLDILSLQDSLSDQAEKIGYLASMRPVEWLKAAKEDFSFFCQKNMEIFWLVRGVIKELDELLDSSFGGMEAEKVKGMVEQIAFFEYEVDLLGHLLIKTLYNKGDSLSPSLFHLHYTLIQEIGELAHLSERLANRIRMLLDLR